MNEQWKAIPGYEGRYRVSDRGRVRNAAGKVLARNLQNSGYYIVHLYSGGRASRKPYLIHRLVLAAFVGVDNAHCNHKDGDKGNNALGNLERATRSENMQHAFATGLAEPPRMAVVGYPLCGGEPVRFASQVEAEEKLRGRRTGLISRCLAGKCGSGYGYEWRTA